VAALQTWLKGANYRVVIPYAKKLTAMVPEIAVRLRRDFHHVLTLIKAHALLHQCAREKDDKGRIIATVADMRPFMTWSSASSPKASRRRSGPRCGRRSRR
jgi:hypothetical protein